MNAFDKIKKSWWVILSFIMFLNGFGFIYIGVKYSNRNWIMEGVMYELQWFIYLIYFSIFGGPQPGISHPSSLIILFALILLFVSVIRSVWVAVKLSDIYDNEEKYTIQATSLNSTKDVKNTKDSNSGIACCLCILIIFIIFVIIAL